jgi:hypothetical protein
MQTRWGFAKYFQNEKWVPQFERPEEQPELEIWPTSTYAYRDTWAMWDAPGWKAGANNDHGINQGLTQYQFDGHLTTWYVHWQRGDQLSNKIEWRVKFELTANQQGTWDLAAGHIPQ